MTIVHKGLYEDGWSLVKNIVQPYDITVSEEPKTRTQWYYRVSGPPIPNERHLVMAQISPSLEASLIVVATSRMQQPVDKMIVPFYDIIQKLLRDYPVTALYQMPTPAIMSLDVDGLRLTEALYSPLNSVHATIKHLMLNGRDAEVEDHIAAWEGNGTTNVLWRMLSKNLEWNAIQQNKEVDRDSFVMQSVPIMTDAVLTARYDSPLLAKLRKESEKRKLIET